ncbi:MAG: adenylyltransferase/cytidyltransferase family protein [Candidatus Obscuribacterales bacterium]|nr:adenylyltransferase/cytidyltransferase family protein [Candidatus Obscuribacterales bacterium]
MSVSLIHHGHIRLLQKAKELGGEVIVALTTDDEIEKHKGYQPELPYSAREEILRALSCVDDVVPAPWLITQEYVDKQNVDFLVHSGANPNPVSNLHEFERTEGISSTDMRIRAIAAAVGQLNRERLFLTPGPGNLHAANLQDLRPAFTRGDQHYQDVAAKVLNAVKAVSGHDHIAAMQGSATTAIEVAMSNWLSGNVLVVISGYYSQRLLHMVERKKSLELKSVSYATYDEFMHDPDRFQNTDWILFAYTETADAFLAEIKQMRKNADLLKANLMVDATGSINLEDDHDLGDIVMFSSCKGLGGLTGAGFITFNKSMLSRRNNKDCDFILDIETYLDKKTTPPAHALQSLSSLSEHFDAQKKKVREGKAKFIDLYKPYLVRKTNQPALSTKVKGANIEIPEWMIAYQPRTIQPGEQVVCHLFEQCFTEVQVGKVYEKLQNSSFSS